MLLLELLQSTWSVASAVAVIATVALAGRSGVAADARLAPCPDSPNCVSTLATDSRHAIEPLTYAGSAEHAQDILRAIVTDMPRSKVVEDEAGYLHVEFRSLIFRFVDDVEFVIDDEAKQVHFRSAARMGYGDMGVNRKRMERVRSAFDAAMQEAGAASN